LKRSTSAQVGFQLADADIALARDQRHVALRLLQQRQEQVFDIDLVLAQRHAQAGGARWRRRGWCRSICRSAFSD
jgi:IS5 family transposase